MRARAAPRARAPQPQPPWHPVAAAAPHARLARAPPPARSVWNRAPLVVDLVSAVHIADAGYYADLQSRLSSYDRVLYELVADKRRAPADGGRWRPQPPGAPGGAPRRRGRGLVGAVQRFAARALQLSFQLEQLDYSRDNWYHADLELERFLALQKAKGESLLRLAAKATRASMAALAGSLAAPLPPGAPARAVWLRRTRAAQALLPLPLLLQLVLHGALSAADAQPLSRSPVAHAFLNLDVAAGLKLVLAEALADADGVAEQLKGSVIVGDRNAAAMDELHVAVRDGARRVAGACAAAAAAWVRGACMAGKMMLTRCATVRRAFRPQCCTARRTCRTWSGACARS